MSSDSPALPNPSGSLIPASWKPLLLLLGVAAAVAAGVGIALWSQGKTYSLLYGDLGAEDSAKMVQALESAGIPYKLDDKTGAITVPSERVHDARLKLAGQGLPEGDGGFAMISKDPGFGVSQFMEGARYQHALETELGRTISNLQAVAATRVHLALPRQSAFVRDRRPASASVFLQLKPGRRLESEQVTAIVNLVASSIPELEAGQVTVVDQTGRLLSAPEGHDEFAARDKQMQIARNMEELYTHRIEELLQPLVGAGRVRAQVVADVELSTTEEAREQYRPDSQTVRSEQISEETSRNGSGPQGVPGALTNQPPVPGTALAPGQTAPGNTTTVASTSGPDSSSKQATKNYEIDRTVAYTKQPAGRLKRLTVAVLVDNLRTTNDEGEVTETAITPQQIENMTKLVREAVGFNQERGDSVSVVNASFRGEPAPEELEPEAPSLLDNPLMRDIAKLVLGSILVLVLVFVVIRPLVRGLIAQAKANAAARPAAAPIYFDGNGTQMLPQGAGAPVKVDYETQVQQARTMVSQDPGRVAQVVKAWVATDE
ncbi:MAG TPA: flagellar basal-body MS-ring/collar protein FliF [Steroidobacteraceae bacterium]|nr:flagellar basal-body MS-ring/collar protein FliF [Steroidobacteraceae bacterium]